MGTTLKIAFRNLLRHKRRTLLTGIVITFGLWMYIFMDSIMSGLDRGSMDNMINLTTSAVQINTKEYNDDRESLPLKHGLQDLESLDKTVREHPRVKGTAPRTRFLGELSNYEESTPVMGTILDPVRDKEVFTLPEYLEGEWFGKEDIREVILGKELAADLGVEPGGFITMFALTRYESRNADDFKVIGILKTTDPAINKSGVYITYTAANDFLDLENTVTELNVGLKHRVNFDDMVEDMRSVQAHVQRELPGLSARSFEDLGAGILEFVKQKKAWGAGMTFVFLLIAAVGIVNSVLMSVYERIREVGVLRAMGMDGKDITRMFMVEGIIIGFIGSFTGALLGILTVLVLTTYGYPMEVIYKDMYVDTTGFPMWGTVYGEWNIPLIVGVFLLGIIIAVFASIPPARKAAKMEVTKALRFI